MMDHIRVTRWCELKSIVRLAMVQRTTTSLLLLSHLSMLSYIYQLGENYRKYLSPDITLRYRMKAILFRKKKTTKQKHMFIRVFFQYINILSYFLDNVIKMHMQNSKL